MTDGSARVETDQELARRARSGDADAFVALYRRYAREVYGYLLRQLGNAQDAEDVTSEAFLRLVRGLGDYRGQSSFRTWMYVVARNCLRDHWRHQTRRPATEALPEDRAASEWMPVGARPEVTALGRAVLARLPDRYRRVLELRVMDGRSVRDTAEAMSISEGNVKVLQHRALKRAARIAAELADETGGGDDDEA